MTATRTPEDIAADRQTLIERFRPTLATADPSRTTHIRLDELATLCGFDIAALRAERVTDELTDTPELREARDRAAAAQARIAKARAEQLEREADQLEQEAAAAAAPKTKPAPKPAADAKTSPQA